MRCPKRPGSTARARAEMRARFLSTRFLGYAVSMSHRVRVLEPFAASGLLPLCLAAGIANGVVATWAFSHFSAIIGGLIAPVFQSRGAIIAAPLMSLVWIAFPAFFAWLIARIFQRFGRALLCGLVQGIGCHLGVLASYVSRNPNELVAWFVPTSPGTGYMLPAIAIGGAILMLPTALIIFGIALLVVRTLGSRVVIQTGTLCWSCGYDLGVVGLGQCPECGASFLPNAPPRIPFARATQAAVRRGWLLLSLSLVLAIMPIGWVVVAYIAPSIRFSRAARPPAEPRESFIPYCLDFSSPRGHFASTSNAGWWIPDAPGSTNGFAVQFLPHPESNEPMLYVSRAFVSTLYSPAGTLDSGTPRINCLLREGLARQVIAAGTLPPDLLDAIRNESVKQGWSPTTFSGVFNDHTVDPAPFFHPAPLSPAPGKP